MNIGMLRIFIILFAVVAPIESFAADGDQVGGDWNDANDDGTTSGYRASSDYPNEGSDPSYRVDDDDLESGDTSVGDLESGVPNPSEVAGFLGLHEFCFPYCSDGDISFSSCTGEFGLTGICIPTTCSEAKNLYGFEVDSLLINSCKLHVVSAENTKQGFCCSIDTKSQKEYFQFTNLGVNTSISTDKSAMIGIIGALASIFGLFVYFGHKNIIRNTAPSNLQNARWNWLLIMGSATALTIVGIGMLGHILYENPFILNNLSFDSLLKRFKETSLVIGTEWILSWVIAAIGIFLYFVVFAASPVRSIQERLEYENRKDHVEQQKKLSQLDMKLSKGDINEVQHRQSHKDLRELYEDRKRQRVFIYLGYDYFDVPQQISSG